MSLENKREVYYSQLVHNGWKLYLAATKNGLCFVGSFDEDFEEMESWFIKQRPEAQLIKDEGQLIEYIVQMKEYIDGNRKVFDLPIDTKGTFFQEEVWHELQNIPFGEIRSYSDIAERIGRPKAVRAVGAAIGANPVMIVIPCHRVLSKSGKLTGFRGGLPMKEKLLHLERQ
jgi:O-6-methylguanine DNA methyltransferase